MADDPRWISISAYALLYGVSRTTVYKWLHADLLETWSVNHLIRVRNRPPRVRRCARLSTAVHSVTH
jgi:hypothetical protein